MCFHWAPNAVMPSAVIRSTTCAGTSAGAICGGEVGGNAWAEAWVANVSGTVTSAAQVMSPATLLVRMVSSRLPPPAPSLPSPASGGGYIDLPSPLAGEGREGAPDGCGHRYGAMAGAEG